MSSGWLLLLIPFVAGLPVALFVRWLNQPRPKLAFEFAPGFHGHGRAIEFRTRLVNDGTAVARGVLVRGYLDGEVVAEAELVDVRADSEPVHRTLALDRPRLVDLSKALNDQPVFYGKTFTATATHGRRTLGAEWDHAEPPEWRGESEETALRREFLAGHIRREDEGGDDDRYVAV